MPPCFGVAAVAVSLSVPSPAAKPIDNANASPLCVTCFLPLFVIGNVCCFGNAPWTPLGDRRHPAQPRHTTRFRQSTDAVGCGGIGRSTQEGHASRMLRGRFGSQRMVLRGRCSARANLSHCSAAYRSSLCRRPTLTEPPTPASSGVAL